MSKKTEKRLAAKTKNDQWHGWDHFLDGLKTKDAQRKRHERRARRMAKSCFNHE